MVESGDVCWVRGKAHPGTEIGLSIIGKKNCSKTKENEKTTITDKGYRNGKYYNYTTEEKFSSTEWSIYGALRLGLSIGKHVNVSVGTDIFSIEVSEIFESLTVSLGFAF